MEPVIILGAGINGCAIARQLAGKRPVLVIERDRVGSGTSSKSSKLVHGGLRYLEQARLGQVQESLRDRKRLCRLYPELVELVPFYLPVYQDGRRSAWKIKSGLWLYDRLARSDRNFVHSKIEINEYRRRFPELRAENLKKVYCYTDGRTDDRELTRRLAEDARLRGARILEGIHVRAVSLRSDGIRVTINSGGKEAVFRTPCLINATGPWIDEVNQTLGLPARYRIAPVSGIHLVVRRELVSECLLLQTEQRRVFFFIPWKNETTLIGTTERLEHCVCDAVQPRDEDVDYLLNQANRYLRQPLTREEIEEVFIGVRPLIRAAGETDLTRMSREYRLDLVKRGNARLIHVFGGKLTTCLSLAEKVEKLC